MKYKAHEYQEYATRFILDHPEAAVFLEMGPGKSVITLTAILRALRRKDGSQEGLIRAVRAETGTEKRGKTA